MKKTTTTLFALSFVTAMVLGTASCSKEKTNEAPTITMEEPANNSTVTFGNEIHVEGTATDDNELHEMAIWITYMGDTVANSYPNVHAQKSYEFHTHHQAAAAGTYTVNVVAVDHDGLTATETRTVSVQ